MNDLPLPKFYNPRRVEELRLINYDAIHDEAIAYRKAHDIAPGYADQMKTAILIIDMQKTFCHRQGQLYVGGRSGNGGVEDTTNTCEWLLGNLRHISYIACTLDTHRAWQISHRIFWIDSKGEHPAPNSILTQDDILNGVWRPNPAVIHSVPAAKGNYAWLCAYAEHYVKELTANGSWPLMVWGYHAMLGGTDHSLMDNLQEVVFFHNICRQWQTDLQVKGGNQLTENYSIFSPEVLLDHEGKPIPGAQKNAALLNLLMRFDRVVIIGEAKSHCVLWSARHIMREFKAVDPALLKKLWFVEDLTTAVIVPDYDFTDDADAAYRDLFREGANIVKRDKPLSEWK